MTTIEDAVNAQIHWYEKQKHPSHSTLHNRKCDIWIKVLRTAPRELSEIGKIIDHRKRDYDETDSWEQQYPVYIEIPALEWVRMIVRCSDKERGNWSQLA